MEFSMGGLTFFFFTGGAPVGPENPLKSIDFTGPGGGGLAPYLTTPLLELFKKLYNNRKNSFTQNKIFKQ